MKQLIATLATLMVVATGLRLTPVGAQQREPFKLGTFEHEGRVIVGLVLGDSLVIDLETANGALERRNPLWVRLPMPSDMKDLIARYEYGLRERVHDIADAIRAALADNVQLPYVHDLKSVIILPPVRPTIILATALNYPPHATEMSTGRGAQMSTASAVDTTPAQPMPHFWERKPGDTRMNPYLFLKPSSIVIGSGQPIRIKPKRDQIDWECEFAFVIGQPASHVPLDAAPNHIFGYTLMNDVGDRGSRGDNRYGSDWLLWKSSDTFAPLGPFIVPREFVPDADNLRIHFTLSGTMMQDSNTKFMTHTMPELLHYASNHVTLQPGDVIATGTPGGVGIARTPPIFMKPGDVAACTVDGIGTLTNPVEAWGDKKTYR